MTGVVIRTAEQILAEAGIDENTAWADDAGLTKQLSAALRSRGRSEVQRRYNERGRYLNTAGQGMGADGGQARVAPPVASVDPVSEEEPGSDAEPMVYAVSLPSSVERALQPMPAGAPVAFRSAQVGATAQEKPVNPLAWAMVLGVFLL